jgi:hypothetical protein
VPSDLLGAIGLPDVWFSGTVKSMDRMSSDPLVSTETEVEVDGETAAAIERGIRAAEDEQVVTADEARKRLLTRWNGNSSTRNRP